MIRQRSIYRFLLLALGIFALLSAMWAGLIRIGWKLPPLAGGLPGGHGPLMIVGFLGTLISLERAVALNRPWMYGAPLLTGVGGLAVMLGLPDWIGASLISLGGAGLLAIFLIIIRQQTEWFNIVMFVAALLGLAGSVLWLAGKGISEIVLWWAGYLILTVAGERLEMSRLLLPSANVRRFFMGAAGVFLVGALVSLWSLDIGWRIAGIGMVGMGLWGLQYDIARRTVRQPGLPRFVAIALLSGYVWMVVGGGLAFVVGLMKLYYYDAILHSIFLGFVVSMIFGHAPIIFPAILGIAVPYRVVFYGHLVLLHLSLALRVAGDLTKWTNGRLWGGMLNVIAILVFLGNTLLAARAGRRAVTR